MSEWSGTLYGLGLCGRSLPETATGNEGQEHLTSLVPAPQIHEVAPKGVAGVGGSTEGRADEHKSDGQGADEGRSNRANDSEATVRQTGRDCDCVKDSQLPNLKHYQLQVPTSGYQGPSADSIISDRHGDDRFADNILRALETERLTNEN